MSSFNKDNTGKSIAIFLEDEPLNVSNVVGNTLSDNEVGIRANKFRGFIKDNNIELDAANMGATTDADAIHVENDADPGYKLVTIENNTIDMDNIGEGIEVKSG